MSVQSGITAHSGGGQADAVQLAATFCQVSTSAAHGDSVKLPADIIGPIKVRNDGAKDVGVYPQSGGQIDALGANAVYYLASGSVQEFVQTSATQWYTTNRSLRFVNRGDVASADFTQADLTEDGAFHELSLAAIIPPSAYLRPVSVYATVQAGAGGSSSISLGTTATPGQNIEYAWAAASTYGIINGIVVASATGTIQYRVLSGTAAETIAVRGWWVEG